MTPEEAVWLYIKLTFFLPIIVMAGAGLIYELAQMWRGK